MRTLLTLTFLALALPAASAAGGFATAGLGPPPDGLGPGETWRAEITLLQHGVTPLEGVSPTITIEGPATRTFTARPTGEPGVYVADVVFPTAGSYRYVVDDDFSQVHTFAPVEIGAPAGAPEAPGAGFPGWAIAALGLAGALAAAVALAVVLRRPRLATAAR